MQEVYISVSTVADITLSNIGGITAASTTGSGSWLVTTDDPAGYSLYIKAGTTPALKSSSSSFADYTPAGADPDYGFTVPASTSRFGFSPEGLDITGRFKDNGSLCNAGALDTTNACWDGLTTSDALISQGAANHPNGATTTVKFKAGIGSSFIQAADAYSATITVTAVSL